MMKTTKTARIAFLTLAASLALASCATAPSLYEHRLDMLTKAAKPVTVLAISRDSSAVPSVTFRDAKGRIFVVVDDGLASLKPGEVIR
jgi:hypothetical protein